MKTSDLIYFDNNATTRVDPAVVEEMLPYLTELYGNPSSGYRFGQQVGKALEKARAFYEGPILILSARDQETEKIDALDLGADDYVAKPFGIGELLARLRVALRHRLIREGAEPVITAGDVEVDLVNRRVTRAGEPVRLSPKEYDLLARLAEGGGKVLTHRQLLTAVWGPAHEHDVQYLRVFIGQLRQKLEADPARPTLILTAPGVGYRFGV